MQDDERNRKRGIPTMIVGALELSKPCSKRRYVVDSSGGSRPGSKVLAGSLLICVLTNPHPHLDLGSEGEID